MGEMMRIGERRIETGKSGPEQTLSYSGGGRLGNPRLVVKKDVPRVKISEN